MKKLRLTAHSAFILGLRRSLDERRSPRPPLCPPGRPGGLGGPGAPGDPPAETYVMWLFTGCIVLLVLMVAVFADGSKGETRAMNFQYLFAALVGLAAAALHVYNFEALIWPKLRADCFPSTPFSSPETVKNLYREHWHFLTVSWVLTIGVLFFVTFAEVIPYANLIVLLLIGYWICIVIAIFFITALCLRPGESYLGTLFKSLQWMAILVVVGLMLWGASV